MEDQTHNRTPEIEPVKPTRSVAGARFRRVLILLVGSCFLIAGVALLVLPGPGLVLIAAGLGTLAVEFTWAKRLTARARLWLARVKERNTRRDE